MTLFEGAGPASAQLVLAYDGTDFRGWAAQPDQRTVEGVLRKALTRILRHEPAELTCAGRTDAGVHAWGQVVAFEADPGIDPWRIQQSLNGLLAPEIVVRHAELMAGAFDARRAARSRTYRYTILNRSLPDPFCARTAWWIPEPLDLGRLRLGADPFLGEHDFAAFCRQGPEGTTTRRTVLASAWSDLGDGRLVYEIRAAAFCWQMVRSIVGTLVEVGQGRKRPGDLLGVIRRGDRAAAGQVAPPHGLCLWAVEY